jgi:hypothetical protein
MADPHRFRVVPKPASEAEAIARDALEIAKQAQEHAARALALAEQLQRQLSEADQIVREGLEFATKVEAAAVAAADWQPIIRAAQEFLTRRKLAASGGSARKKSPASLVLDSAIESILRESPKLTAGSVEAELVKLKLAKQKKSLKGLKDRVSRVRRMIRDQNSH